MMEGVAVDNKRVASRPLTINLPTVLMAVMVAAIKDQKMTKSGLIRMMMTMGMIILTSVKTFNLNGVAHFFQLFL